MDPIETMEVLLFKYIIHALELRDSNLYKFIKFWLKNYQPHDKGQVGPWLKIVLATKTQKNSWVNFM